MVPRVSSESAQFAPLDSTLPLQKPTRSWSASSGSCERRGTSRACWVEPRRTPRRPAPAATDSPPCIDRTGRLVGEASRRCWTPALSSSANSPIASPTADLCSPTDHRRIFPPSWIHLPALSTKPVAEGGGGGYAPHGEILVWGPKIIKGREDPYEKARFWRHAPPQGDLPATACCPLPCSCCLSSWRGNHALPFSNYQCAGQQGTFQFHSGQAMRSLVTIQMSVESTSRNLASQRESFGSALMSSPAAESKPKDL